MSLPPPTIDAGHVRLRELGPADWRLEQELSRDAEVVRWTLYPPDLTQERAQERIRRTIERTAQGSSRRYAITVDGEALGVAGIVVAEVEEPEIFYVLLPSARGRGVATAAATALSDWAVTHGPGRVALITIVGNERSEQVARRAGFHLVGEEGCDQRGSQVPARRWRRVALM